MRSAGDCLTRLSRVGAAKTGPHRRAACVWTDVQKTKRRYYVNHQAKSTSWTDPRPAIGLPALRPAGAAAGAAGGRIGSSSGVGGAAAPAASAYDGSQSADLSWYRDMLRMALADKSITPDEDEMLAAARARMHISDSDHQKILRECGWEPADFARVRKEDPYRECCTDTQGEHQQWAAVGCILHSADFLFPLLCSMLRSQASASTHQPPTLSSTVSDMQCILGRRPAVCMCACVSSPIYCSPI